MRYKVTNPLEVEFSTGRITPYLRRTVAEIQAAWDQRYDTALSDSSADEAEEDMCPRDEDTGKPDWQAQHGSVETPTVSHLMLPADWKQEPYWVTRPAYEVVHELYGFPPERIPDTDPERLLGAERRANAGLILQRLEYRAGPLWPVVLGAVVQGKTMADIGREHGGNSVNSAKVGRPLVVAGLRLCAYAFGEIERGLTPEEARRLPPRPIKSIATDRYFARQRAIEANGFLLAPDCHP